VALEIKDVTYAAAGFYRPLFADFTVVVRNGGVGGELSTIQRKAQSQGS
jgi:hypothetical protein